MATIAVPQKKKGAINSKRSKSRGVELNCI
jgi:hypothetical protein